MKILQLKKKEKKKLIKGEKTLSFLTFVGKVSSRRIILKIIKL